MKKNNIVAVGRKQIFKQAKLTIGLDLGDRTSHYCILDEAGNVILESSLPTTSNGIRQAFGRIPRCRIALETGTHSPWVSRQLAQMSHEVIVAHARNVRLIGESSRKDDRVDARTLARLARIDPGLLGPVRHRSAQAQLHLTEIRARAVLVSARTALVNAARGLVKSYGERLRKCGTEQMNRESSQGLSPELRDALEPLLGEIESLNERISEYNRRIEQIAGRSLPRGGPAETSERCGDIDCVDLRSDLGRSTPIPPQPGCRMFSRVASWAQELRSERTATAHQQGRRPLSKNADGARRALHSGALWTRQRSAALGIEAGRVRRKECQEASGGCGGTQVSGSVAQTVGKRRRL